MWHIFCVSPDVEFFVNLYKETNMKNTLLYLGILLFFIPNVQAQNQRFTQDFNPVRSELTKWDPIRGEWLASSLVAMSTKQPIPDRTFPEDLTPVEMLRLVPENHRTSINQMVSTNQRNATDSTGRNEWNAMSSIVSRPNCKPVMARSYGDPHLSSFDNASYSFQTVGEFVLTKSVSGNMEIQTRQQAQSDDFSLNTAAAMNVAGDRVCIYANEKPDNISNTALRLNGAPLQITNKTYFLPHGGTIRYSSNTYIVTWPTGEVANIQLRNSSRMNFLNVSVQIYPCAQNDLTGLLGNANGIENDDFDTNDGMKRPAYMAFSSFGNDQLQQASNEAEKEYLAFLARDYARNFRVTQQTSLFDYGFGQNTLTYTDESFPRVHRTVGDLSADRQNSARQKCEEQGIRGAELKGCIFDQAYLEIPPSPRPEIKDPTRGVVLSRIEKPIENSNAKPGGKEISKDKVEAETNPQTISKPGVKEEAKKENAPIKVNTTTIQKDTKPSGSGTTTKPNTTIKPSGTTIKPSGTSTKPSGTTTTPIKTSPMIKPGKG